MQTKRLWSALAACWALMAAPASAASVSLDPSPSSVALGEAFGLDVRVSDVSDLYAFQFDLVFDPAILRLDQVLEGAFLAGAGTTAFVPGSLEPSVGLLSFAGGTLFGPGPGASGDGVLVRLAFQAVGVGPGELTLGNVVLLDSALAPLPSQAIGRTLTVLAVPEPASALLWALGLGALAAARLRPSRVASRRG